MSDGMASDPMDGVREQIDSLQNRYHDVQAQAQLASVRQAAGDTEAMVDRVIDLARAVRSLGYAWESDLETRCLDMRQRWMNIKPDIMAAIDRQAADLQGRQAQVESQVNWIVQNPPLPESAPAALQQADAQLSSLGSAAETADSTIRGMFSQFASDVATLEQHLNDVRWMLDQAAQSKATWLPKEAIVSAVQAKWQKGNKDDPSGILFLSDQRILFERKEQVATKKVLFVATQKETVQQLLLDVPLAQLATVQAMKQGLLGHEDHLELKFVPGSAAASAHFHIDGQDCQTWQATVSRAKSGGLEGMRVNPISEAEQQRLRSAPTKCPSCGGALNAPVLRGQTEIHCGYCGSVVRF